MELNANDALIFSGDVFFSESELVAELERWSEQDRQYQPQLNPDQCQLFDIGLGTDSDIPFH